jgi:hypothetical protein
MKKSEFKNMATHFFLTSGMGREMQELTKKYLGKRRK